MKFVDDDDDDDDDDDTKQVFVPLPLSTWITFSIWKLLYYGRMKM